MDRRTLAVERAELAPGGTRVRLTIAPLREGYVHELRAVALRAAGGGPPLLHDRAYYTLVRIPAGD
jgi:hypothetical protein